jgi:hypothetical protein
LPPKDLIGDLSAALRRAHLDPDDVFNKCIGVSNEWKYDLNNVYSKPYCERFSQQRIAERTVPMVHKSLEEVLKPQPAASEVLLRLLEFIDRVDVCSQRGESRPDFVAEDGSDMFPTAGHPDELWWLTELSRRNYEERMAKDLLLEDGASSSSDESDSQKQKKKSDDETDVSGDDVSDTAGDTIQSNEVSSSQNFLLLPIVRSMHDSQSSF